MIIVKAYDASLPGLAVAMACGIPSAKLPGTIVAGKGISIALGSIAERKRKIITIKRKEA